MIINIILKNILQFVKFYQKFSFFPEITGRNMEYGCIFALPKGTDIKMSGGDKIFLELFSKKLAGIKNVCTFASAFEKRVKESGQKGSGFYLE